nr:2-amino-4-hydroxy-6-hydroxymethyldihydropteridine diphosphokinase [Oceaniglobus trochenteri]
MSFQSDSNARVLVALGANTTLAGQTREEAVMSALQRLDSSTCRLLKYSRMFMTPCFPAGAGPDYINAVASFETRLTARNFLARLHSVETDLGRERVQRWGSRTMDLDLLAYGESVLPDRATFLHWHDLAIEEQKMRAPDKLIVPHPRMAERAFVLIPLLDIAPDWRHPVSGMTVRQMADALPEAEKSAVIPITN